MSKTKKAQKASQHIMQAMEHGERDLLSSGFNPLAARNIINNSVLAKVCASCAADLGVVAEGAKVLFDDILKVISEFHSTAMRPAPVVVMSKEVHDHVKEQCELPYRGEPTEKPVKPVFEPEEPKKAKTPADILYPKR